MAEENLRRLCQKMRERRPKTEPDEEETKLRLGLDVSTIRDKFSAIVCETLLDIPQQPAQYVSRVKKRCSTCSVIGELMQCKQCKKTYYCSRACQKKDWKRHKPRCEFLVDFFTNGQKLFDDSDDEADAKDDA